MIANPTAYTPPPLPPRAQAPQSRDGAPLKLRDVKGAQLPYNSVNMASIGAGRTGKTATRRSVLGEMFVEGPRDSTEGAEQEHMLAAVQARGGSMLNFQRTERLEAVSQAMASKAAADKALALQQVVSGAASGRKVHLCLIVTML
jgi:hypothetical protein